MITSPSYRCTLKPNIHHSSAHYGILQNCSLSEQHYPFPPDKRRRPSHSDSMLEYPQDCKQTPSFRGSKLVLEEECECGVPSTRKCGCWYVLFSSTVQEFWNFSPVPQSPAGPGSICIALLE